MTSAPHSSMVSEACGPWTSRPASKTRTPSSVPIRSVRMPGWGRKSHSSEPTLVSSTGLVKWLSQSDHARGLRGFRHDLPADDGEALLHEGDDHADHLLLRRLPRDLPRFHHGKDEAEHAIGDH